MLTSISYRLTSLPLQSSRGGVLYSKAFEKQSFSTIWKNEDFSKAF